jgi:GT2 family glycosyltransferase
MSPLWKLFVMIGVMNHLLHPDYFEHIPLVGNTIAQRLNGLSEVVIETQGNVSVAIRTLNEATALEALLNDIQRQKFNGNIDIVVVDNESTDNTVEVAKKFGARVVTLPRDSFTYPRSMNLGMESAKYNHVFLTVGHAQLVSINSLQAAFSILQDPDIAGVFGHALPSKNASLTENFIAIGNLHFTKSREAKKTGLGVMAATGCMIDKMTWEKLGKFDERYEQGGEDGALAAEILKSGYKIIDQPLIGTHHTHGLGFKNTLKQWYGWTKLSKPSSFDRDELVQRRPDINSDK